MVACTKRIAFSVKLRALLRVGLIPTALVVDVPHATAQLRHRWARPDHLHRMVADWDCIVRNLVRVADGRVKPGHDVGGMSRSYRALVLLALLADVRHDRGHRAEPKLEL